MDLEAAGPARQVDGLRHPLRQPALVQRLRLNSPNERALHAWCTAVDQVVDDVPPPQRSDAPTAAQVIERFCATVLAVQRQSGIAVHTRFRARLKPLVDPGCFDCEITLPSASSMATQKALRWALALFKDVGQGPLTPERAQSARDEANRLLRPHAQPGMNVYSILMAAMRLDVPVFQLANDILVLGCGARSRWLMSTISDETSAISVRLARNKHETAYLLRSLGLPGAEHLIVRSTAAAVAAARALGYPVVVKPADGDRGQGVAADLRHDAAVEQAYLGACEVSPLVLVEKWQEGWTHRLTVVSGSLQRVVRRIPGGVCGDGQSDMSTLVARYQSTDRQQRLARQKGQPLLTLDNEALGLLKERGLTVTHIPARGAFVRLRRRDNISAGGDNETLQIEDVHPDNRKLALDTARALRLDFAGIDLITEDISRSWLEKPALICEVNAGPQIGTSSDATFYERLLPKFLGGDGRIDCHLLLCPLDEGERSVVLAQALAMTEVNGVSAREGLWIDGQRVTHHFADGLRAARALLLRTEVQAAVCLMSPGEVLKLGLPINRFTRVSSVPPERFAPGEAILLDAARAMALPPL